MNYKKLGTTDLDVSTICLGTMTWGEQNSQEEGFEQMDYALEQGINFFDTAELYAVPPKKETYGKTEEIIGNWFHERKSRGKVILATKINTPSIEITKYIIEDFRKILTTDAIIIPFKPIIKNDPSFVKSLLVVYP